jgi:hypothetical protein
MPQVRYLELSHALWQGEEIVDSTGPVRLDRRGAKFPPVARPELLVRLYDLGVVRQVRLAVVELRPYHVNRVPGQRGIRQIYDLTFRLEFPPGAQPAEAEPDFKQGFPSGYRGLFSRLVSNAEAMPLGLDDITTKKPEALPYRSRKSLRLTTTREGYHQIPARRLKALGRSLPSPDELVLYQEGREQPFLVLRKRGNTYRPDDRPDMALDEDDRVVFFAPESTSPYSPVMVSYFSPGSRQWKVLPAEPLERADWLRPVQSVQEEYQVEQNHRLWQKMSSRKDASQHKYWIWQQVDADNPFEHRFEFPPELSPESRGVRIRMVVRPDVPSRNFSLRNYHFLIAGATTTGDMVYPRPDNSDPSLFTIMLNARGEDFEPGQNSFDFSIVPAVRDATGSQCPAFSIDYFDLIYERQLVLDQSPVHWNPQPRQYAWQVSGGATAPEDRLAIGRQSGGGLFLLPVLSGQDGLVVEKSAASADLDRVDLLPVTPALPEPDIELSRPNRLSDSARRADVILITHPDFLSEVQLLASWRRSQGYSVEVVSVEDIYRDFGDGRLNPESIQAFLRYTLHHWKRPAPTYVLLVGDARWDYWGYLDQDIPNLVPSYHPAPAYASDDWFARISGDDPLPDMLVSRISVSNIEDLKTAVRKIINYEAKPEGGLWRGRILFVSDNEEVFEEECESQISTQLPLHYQPRHIRVRDFPFVDNFYMTADSWREKRAKCSPACNEAIMEAVEEGVFIWEYYGHGSPNVFADERIFFGGGSAYSDIKKMTNGLRLPLLVALTCDTIQFDYSGEVGPQWTLCMGEELLTHPGGGAVAVYGSTGRGFTSHHVLLNTGFHQALFKYGFRSLGELVSVSKLLCYLEVRTAEPLEMFGLLGDVLTRLDLARPRGEVKIAPDAISNATGHKLEVEASFNQLEPEQRRQLSASVSVTGDAFKILSAEKDLPLPVTGPLRYSFQTPRGIQPGTGRASVLVYPKEDTGVLLPEGAGSEYRILAATAETDLATGTAADLVISNDAIQLKPESPRNGETVFLDVAVHNRGDAPAEDVLVMAYDGDPSAQGYPLEDRAGYGPAVIGLIPRSATRTIRLRWDPYMNSGRWTLHVVADPEDAIAEHRENNNSATAELYVREKIDLALLEEDFDYFGALPGERIQVRAGVRNTGQTVSEPVPIRVLVYDQAEGGEPIEEYVIEKEQVPRIPPRRRVRFPLEMPEETVRFEMVVDPDDIADEETFENNRITVYVEDLTTQGTSGEEPAEE